jgi:uncharacterized membrane protein
MKPTKCSKINCVLELSYLMEVIKKDVKIRVSLEKVLGLLITIPALFSLPFLLTDRNGELYYNAMNVITILGPFALVYIAFVAYPVFKKGSAFLIYTDKFYKSEKTGEDYDSKSARKEAEKIYDKERKKEEKIKKDLENKITYEKNRAEKEKYSSEKIKPEWIWGPILAIFLGLISFIISLFHSGFFIAGLILLFLGIFIFKGLSFENTWKQNLEIKRDLESQDRDFKFKPSEYNSDKIYSDSRNNIRMYNLAKKMAYVTMLPIFAGLIFLMVGIIVLFGWLIASISATTIIIILLIMIYFRLGERI